MIHTPIQLHANVTPDVTDRIVLLYVQMIALVWEHVIQPQEPAYAIKDAMGMIALLFALMIVLVWEHVILQQEHANAMLDVPEMTVPSLPTYHALVMVLAQIKESVMS